MSEPILTPALTQEEWAAVKAGELVLDNARFHSVPAIMAIANATLSDGDPRKITREDVELLRELMSENQYTLTDGSNHDLYPRAAQFRALAAKLAALLPPHPTIGGTGVE